MTEHLKHEYRAYLWTLAALVMVYFGTMVAAGIWPDLMGKLEVFGLGTVTGGLIGLLRTPRQAQPPSQHHNVTQNNAGDPEPPKE
jgi:hypothetical protein